MEIKGLVWQGNGDCSASIDLVAEYERDTGVLCLQLSVKGIVHEISVDLAVVCKAKGVLKECASILRQPYMWDGGVNKS